MNNVYEKPRIVKLIDSIKHQGIGGKTIVLEREGTISYALDMPFDKMTIGLYNFVQRRPDLMTSEKEDTKLYYGHVGTLGYFVAEDEFDGDIKEVDWSEASEYLQ